MEVVTDTQTTKRGETLNPSCVLCRGGAVGCYGVSTHIRLKIGINPTFVGGCVGRWAVIEKLKGGQYRGESPPMPVNIYVEKQ